MTEINPLDVAPLPTGDDLADVVGNRAFFQNLSSGSVFTTALGMYQTPTGTVVASQIVSGTGVPNNANGSNGDYYFRLDGTASNHIYFKTGGAWVALI